jgi:hypothetical protein
VLANINAVVIDSWFEPIVTTGSRPLGSRFVLDSRRAAGGPFGGMAMGE